MEPDHLPGTAAEHFERAVPVRHVRCLVAVSFQPAGDQGSEFRVGLHYQDRKRLGIDHRGSSADCDWINHRRLPRDRKGRRPRGRWFGTKLTRTVDARRYSRTSQVRLGSYGQSELTAYDSMQRDLMGPAPGVSLFSIGSLPVL